MRSSLCIQPEAVDWDAEPAVVWRPLVSDGVDIFLPGGERRTVSADTDTMHKVRAAVAAQRAKGQQGEGATIL